MTGEEGAGPHSDQGQSAAGVEFQVEELKSKLAEEEPVQVWCF